MIYCNVGVANHSLKISDYIPNLGAYGATAWIENDLGGLSVTTTWDWDNFWMVLNGTATLYGQTVAHLRYLTAGDVEHLVAVNIHVDLQPLSYNIEMFSSQNMQISSGVGGSGFTLNMTNSYAGLITEIVSSIGGTYVLLTGSAKRFGTSVVTFTFVDSGITYSQVISLVIVESNNKFIFQKRFYNGDGEVAIYYDGSVGTIGSINGAYLLGRLHISYLGNPDIGYLDTNSLEGTDDVFGNSHLNITIEINITDNKKLFESAIWIGKAIRFINIVDGEGFTVFSGYADRMEFSGEGIKPVTDLHSTESKNGNKSISLTFTTKFLQDIYFKNDAGDLDKVLIDEIFGQGQATWDHLVNTPSNPIGGFLNVNSWLRVRYVFEKLLIYFGASSVEFGNMNGVFSDGAVYYYNSGDPLLKYHPSTDGGVTNAGIKNRIFDRLLIAKNWIFGISNGMQAEKLTDILGLLMRFTNTVCGISSTGIGYVRARFAVDAEDIITLDDGDILSCSREQGIYHSAVPGIALAGYYVSVRKPNPTDGWYDDGIYFNEQNSNGNKTYRGDVQFEGKGDGNFLYKLDKIFKKRVITNENNEVLKFEYPFANYADILGAYYSGAHLAINSFALTRSEYNDSPATAMNHSDGDHAYNDNTGGFSDLWFYYCHILDRFADQIYSYRKIDRIAHKFVVNGIYCDGTSAFKIYNRLFRPVHFKPDYKNGITEITTVDINE